MTKRSRAALIIYLFLVTSTFGFLQPFSPLYLESAGLTRDQIGWVFGLGSGIALVLQPLWGRLSDRFDTRRPFIILSALASGIAYLAFRGAGSFGAFLALTAVGANGLLYLNSVGGVLIGRLVQSSQGGAAYAGYRVWGSVGYILVTLATGLLLNPRGLKLDRPILDQVFTFGPLLFFSIATVAFFLPDAKDLKRAAVAAGKAPISENLRWFLLSYFLYIFALYGASNFLSLFMKELGGSSLWITAMFAGGVICEVLVMRVSGKFSDDFGRRPLLAITYLLLPFRLMLYVAMVSPMGVLVVQLLHGINFGIMGAISIAMVNDLADNTNRGQSQSRLAATAGLASTVAPIVFGRIAQSLGLKAMFAAASLMAFAGMVVFLLKVCETHLGCKPIADRGPRRLAWFLKLLDAPPGR